MKELKKKRSLVVARDVIARAVGVRPSARRLSFWVMLAWAVALPCGYWIVLRTTIPGWENLFSLFPVVSYAIAWVVAGGLIWCAQTARMERFDRSATLIPALGFGAIMIAALLRMAPFDWTTRVALKRDLTARLSEVAMLDPKATLGGKSGPSVEALYIRECEVHSDSHLARIDIEGCTLYVLREPVVRELGGAVGRPHRAYLYPVQAPWWYVVVSH